MGDLQRMDSSVSSLASLSISSSPASETPATSVRSQGKSSRAYKFSTLCATVDNPDANHRDQFGSSSVPIYQTATFKGMGGEYDYTRSGNPTRKFLENHIAKISSARHAFAVSSGMGALDVIFRMLQPGDEIIAGNDLYGGSNRLLTYLKQHNNITTHHISTTDPANFLPYLTKPDSKVKMVLLETPTNPLLQIADLSAIADLVHNHIPDALIIVDNTMMSPYLQRPLEHGADIVYDSATKYLSGHHDLMAGVIVCDRQDVAKRIAFTINSVGNGLAPFDCFLLLRGTKTLALRMDQQQLSAQAVAEYLDRLGFQVHFPGLAKHPGKEVHDKHARGPGAVLSFVTGDKALSERIVAAARLWGISVSFGCVNSLISMPCLMSHASIDPAVRAARNLPEDLIRLCVGIEDTEDLIDDLEAALLEAGAIRFTENAYGERQLQRAGAAINSSLALPISSEDQSTQNITSMVVSAPGKIILFGEHAVVHGHLAVAGALGLRCYCLIEPRLDNKISISLPDVNIERDWDISSLPLPKHPPELSETPDAHLLEALAPFASSEDALTNSSVLSFLYLYACLSRHHGTGCSFVVRATLPIGAGLGSSAAYSVCIATALLYLHSHLPFSQISSSVEDAEVHHGRRGIPNDHARVINGWAYLGEKINHGSPSGVDNACACFGDAIAFQRSATSGVSAKMEALHGFQSLRFLLTNTKVPRNTKALVAHVGVLKANQPQKIQPVFDAIHNVSEEARKTLTDVEVPRQMQISILESLIRQNAALLEELEVGHAALETVRVKTAASPYHLSTKLTGAGGGGCAVTLIPDGFDQSKLDQLKKELSAVGFECYETSVGGSGCGLSIPKHTGQKVTTEGGVEAETIPLRKRFLDGEALDLERFLSTQRWHFV